MSSASARCSSPTASTATAPTSKKAACASIPALYSVRISNADGSIISDSASLELTGVPTGIWRGLVACYPFDGSGPRWAFGRSVSISGSLVAVGGWLEGGGAYFFNLGGPAPTAGIRLERPAGVSGAFGDVVAIADSRVLVASPGGKAHVYNLSTGLPTLTLTVPGYWITMAITGAKVLVGSDGTGGGAIGKAFLFDLNSAAPTVAVPLQNAPGPATGDSFGNSVAVSGKLVVVGAPVERAFRGGAYVYDRSGGTPTLPVAMLTVPPQPGENEFSQFGHSVAISGSRVVVGSWTGSASVDVFTLSSNGSPSVLRKLINPGSGAGFGTAVAISGPLVVVGARYSSVGSSNAGSAYVYNLDSAQVAPMATLHNPGPQTGDQFGAAVAISGGRVVVGVPYDSIGAFQAGSVSVYDLSGATPTVPVATLNNPSPGTQEYFGASVAIAGTKVVVGTPFDSTSAPQAGSAYVYDLNTATPTVPAVILNNPRPGVVDRFGVSVALSGTRIVVGVIGTDAGAALDAGSVFVYDLNSATPTVPVTELINPAPMAGGIFGNSVAIDGSTIAIGAPWDDAIAHDKGSAYFFGLSSPEMVVESQPAQEPLVEGSAQSFDSVFVDNATSLRFTIRNIGPKPLTGLATTIDGPNPADFTVTTSPVAPVSGPSGATSFTVRFAPKASGPRTAAVHIASNDPDDPSFDIQLVGTGLEPVNRVVDQGSMVSFSAGPGVSMQWRKDGVDIPGAVGTTLTLPSVQPWQIGVYSVRMIVGATTTVSDVAMLGIPNVPGGVWRGLIACYPFDGTGQDVCREAKPAVFAITSGLVIDPQRGGVARIEGKGFAVPPLGEPVALQGPGGYLQIPRPPLDAGEPFTVSMLVKEEGFSLWHGESFVTMGEGAASVDLIGHYWIGSLDGTTESYGGNNVAVVPHTSTYVLNGLAVALTSPWTAYTAVGEGTTVRLFRNGQLLGSIPYKKDTAGDFFIGRHWWENGANYSTRLIARVDDLRIYNRALTTPEVQQLFSQVQTTPPAGSFESWALIHGLSGTDATKSGDPDRDRLSNWDEFSFGASPIDGTGSLLKARSAGDTLILEWLQTVGVRYDLKETSDLVSPWSPSPKVPTMAADQNGVPAGYQRIQVSIPIPQPGAPADNRFFRVEATSDP